MKPAQRSKGSVGRRKRTLCCKSSNTFGEGDCIAGKESNVTLKGQAGGTVHTMDLLVFDD